MHAGAAAARSRRAQGTKAFWCNLREPATPSAAVVASHSTTRLQHASHTHTLRDVVGSFYTASSHPYRDNRANTLTHTPTFRCHFHCETCDLLVLVCKMKSGFSKGSLPSIVGSPESRWLWRFVHVCCLALHTSNLWEHNRFFAQKNAVSALLTGRPSC